MTKLHQPKLILASASPRRKELLTKAGYKFEVVVSKIDESVFPTENIEPAEYAKRLALAKARDVAAKFSDCFVLGADTVVDFNGEIIGKPADSKEAELIIRKIFSAPHKVITAVAIVGKNSGFEIVESDTTIIYPKELTDAKIAEHIEGGSWLGKAGAFGIAENGDDSFDSLDFARDRFAQDRFIERIEGSLTNVMGLPMELLERMLKLRM